MYSPDLLGTLLDISLPLCVFLAAIATMLVVTYQMLSSHYGKVNILISKKRLRNVTIIVVVAFIITMAIIIFAMITSPSTIEEHLNSTLLMG
jgi:hypothetical protein